MLKVVFPEVFVNTCRALAGPFEPVVLLEDSEQSHTKGKAESQAVRKVLHSSSCTTLQVSVYLQLQRLPLQLGLPSQIELMDWKESSLSVETSTWLNWWCSK